MGEGESMPPFGWMKGERTEESLKRKEELNNLSEFARGVVDGRREWGT